MSDRPIRAFLAIDPPPDARSHLARLSRALAARCARERVVARFVPPANLHLTLRFLGDVEPGRVDDVGAAMRVAARTDPFEIAFGGLGAFPSVRKPTVLWVGIARGADSLKTLAEQVDRCLSGVGFTPEAREFRPHLTLARVRKAPSGVARVVHPVSPEETPASPATRVTEMVLYQSELGSGGSRYTPLFRAPLAL